MNIVCCDEDSNIIINILTMPEIVGLRENGSEVDFIVIIGESLDTAYINH